MNKEMHNSDNGGDSGRRSANLFIRGVKTLLSLALLLLLIATALVEYLTLMEYRPEDREEIAVMPGSTGEIGPGKALRILTWNCGYGALGDNADFFMDGGKGVYTADQERVESNLDGIIKATAQMEPDVIFYQEVDRRSDRSRHVDEQIYMNNSLEENSGMSLTSAYAYNFNVPFVPYPIPPIGKVRSGLLTFCSMPLESAERIQLPCPFRWPIRTANLKRCLLLGRIPLKNSDHYLVLINLHLEAYDNGEGKAAQTKMLRDILRREAEAGNYVIAGGDFNQTFSSTDISGYPVMEGMWAPGRIETDEIGEGWQCLMDSSVPTCRSLDRPYAGADHENFQYYVIDGFIVSSNIEVKSCRTRDMDFVHTDHNPVLLECVLK